MAEASQRFVTAEHDAWMNVAAAIDARMAELGIDQRTVVSRAEDAGAKLSQSSLGKLLSGARPSYRPTTLRVTSLALGWSGDSIERILRGEPPEVVAGEDSLARRVAILEETTETLRRVLTEIRDRQVHGLVETVSIEMPKSERAR